MAENESLVGRMTGMDKAGLGALKAELGGVRSSISSGLGMGVLELATGGSKVKAIWESIKWAALARAGLAGFSILAGGALALTAGIRKAVTESGILQVAMEKLGQTKVLTTQFTAFLGSVDAAKRRVAELFAYVANSKFNLGEVANASKVLTILSNGAEGGVGTLNTLGRIAVSTGSDLQELATAYGRVNEQTRNRQDISGTLNDLKNMGVISEATANQLIELQASGASGSTIMAEFKNNIAAVAAASGATEESFASLQDKVEKLKAAAAAGFGEAWMEQEKKSLQNQVNLYEALIPAAQKLGTMLEFVSRPAVGLQNTFGTIAGTDWFKGTLATLAQMAVTLPVIAAGYGAIKGLITLGKTTREVGAMSGLKGIWQRAKGAISPAAASENLLGTSGRLIEQAGSKAGMEKTIFTVMGHGAKIGSIGLEYFSKGLALARVAAVRLVGALAGFAIPAAAVTVVAYIGVKAWDAWRDSVARAKHASDMLKESFGVSSKMTAEIAGLKTLDDKTRLLTKARQELNDALKAQAALRGDENSTREEEAAAAALVMSRQRAVRQVEATKDSGLGASAKVMEYKFQQLRIEKEIAAIVFAAEFERASGAKQTLMLMEKQRDNAKIVADYEKSRAQQPTIEALDRTIEQGATERAEKGRGLGQEFGNLSKRERELEYIQRAAGATGDSDAELKQVRDRIAQIREQGKTLTKPMGVEAAAIAEKEKLQTGPGAAHFDQLQAAAAKARGEKKEGVAQGLELEAAKWRIKSEEDAKKDATEAAQQLQTRKRQGKLRQNELNVNEKALKITSETYEAEDEFAKAKMAGIERQRSLLVDVGKSADPEVQQERDNQIRGFEQQQAELQKDIDERARGRALETAAWKSAIDAHKLNNAAVLAAAKGNYMQADAALKAAQGIEDAQAQLDRAVELRAKGYKEPEIKATVAAEQRQREEDRSTRADSFRTRDTRRQEESELQLGMRGIGPSKITGAAAQQKLIGMRDADEFRSILSKNMEELGPGNAAEASKRAMAEMSTNILAQTPQQGEGQVADSMTRIGGGGGIYGGATGDPQLAAAKRIAELANNGNTILGEIRDTLKKGQGVK